MLLELSTPHSRSFSNRQSWRAHWPRSLNVSWLHIGKVTVAAHRIQSEWWWEQRAPAATGGNGAKKPVSSSMCVFLEESRRQVGLQWQNTSNQGLTGSFLSLNMFVRRAGASLYYTFSVLGVLDMKLDKLLQYKLPSMRHLHQSRGWNEAVSNTCVWRTWDFVTQLYKSITV